jgi:membrane-associated progesterone receptor component
MDATTIPKDDPLENAVQNATGQTINLLPYLLLLPLAYLLYNLIFPTFRKDFTNPPSSHNESYNFRPSEHPSTIVFRKYTPKELSVFDGKGVDQSGKPVKILLAIERRTRKRGEDGIGAEVREERTVFDVSAGRSFYGPGKWQ